MEKKIPKVTVGVPVFNGGDMFRDCLENLRTQTASDFKVVIFDNASTDNTGDIARDYVERDSRFEYHRHDENIGAFKNFVGLLEAARSEYFIWRAFDDYSDANFLEELTRLLDGNPEADLAVGRVTSLREGRKRKTLHTAAPTPPRKGLWGGIRLVKGAAASWIYGLWRTDALRKAWDEVVAIYPHGWGGDFMVLFDALFRCRVVGADNTTFYQRITQRDYKSQDDNLQSRISTLQTYRADAERYFRLKEAELSGGRLERLIFAHLSKWYVDQRIYSARKLRRLQAKAAG